MFRAPTSCVVLWAHRYVRRLQKRFTPNPRLDPLAPEGSPEVAPAAPPLSPADPSATLPVLFVSLLRKGTPERDRSEAKLASAFDFVSASPPRFDSVGVLCSRVMPCLAPSLDSVSVLCPRLMPCLAPSLDSVSVLCPRLMPCPSPVAMPATRGVLCLTPRDKRLHRTMRSALCLQLPV